MKGYRTTSGITMTRRRIDTHGFRRIAEFSAIFGVAAWVLIMTGVFGMVMILDRIGLSCEKSCIAIWCIAVVFGLFLPFTFVRFIRRHFLDFDKVHEGLILFNIVEYTCLVIVFSSLFATPDLLCNSGDGQVAMGIAFAGWMVIPVLYVINYFTERILKRLRKAGK